MKETDTVKNKCWFCDGGFDAASDIEGDKKPSPGDISVCLYCAAPGVFLESMAVRKPTDSEMARILEDEGVLRHIMAVTMVVRERLNGGKKP